MSMPDPAPSDLTSAAELEVEDDEEVEELEELVDEVFVDEVVEVMAEVAMIYQPLLNSTLLKSKPKNRLE